MLDKSGTVADMEQIQAQSFRLFDTTSALIPDFYLLKQSQPLIFTVINLLKTWTSC